MWDSSGVNCSIVRSGVMFMRTIIGLALIICSAAIFVHAMKKKKLEIASKIITKLMPLLLRNNDNTDIVVIQ